MTTQVFVSMAVKDLNKSIEFFTHLGFTFNPQFASEQGACIVINDSTSVMLVIEPLFQSFTDKKVIDARTHAEMQIGLTLESRDAVDALVKKAIDAGGTAPRDAEEQGFMYSHDFHDLDGHTWGIFCMTPIAEPASQE